MKRLLVAVLLGATTSAHAGTWTLGLDGGASRLDARDYGEADDFLDNDVDTRAAIGVRGAYWFTPNLALEGELLHADTAVGSRVGDIERDMTALLIGGRAQASIGNRSFVYVRGGYAQQWIDTSEPRFVTVGNVTTVSFVKDDSHAGHYLGLGLGWRWSERWSSSVELARLYGDVGYACGDDFDCSTTNPSYFDLATFGVAYHFD